MREYWIVFPEEKKVLVYRFENAEEPIEYTFADKIPVAIWEGACEIDFAEIYDRIGFMYDGDEE